MLTKLTVNNVATTVDVPPDTPCCGCCATC